MLVARLRLTSLSRSVLQAQPCSTCQLPPALRLKCSLLSDMAFVRHLLPDTAAAPASGLLGTNGPGPLLSVLLGVPAPQGCWAMWEQYCFSEEPPHCYPRQVPPGAQDSNFSASLPALSDSGHLSGFDWHVPQEGGVELLCMCLLAIRMSSSETRLFKSFGHFKAVVLLLWTRELLFYNVHRYFLNTYL